MGKPDKKFLSGFTPKTPEQATREALLETQDMQLKAYRAASAPMKILTEDLKKATDRFFKSSDNNTNQVLHVEISEEKTRLVEQIKLDDPLVVKNGSISIDYEKLSEAFSSQMASMVQSTLEKVRQNTFEAGSLAGGGGVSIRFKEVGGEKVNILKSVNDIIFTGDGVTLTRQGKNVLVNIPGASLVAGDPTIDFAREASILQMQTALEQIFNQVNNIQGVVIPTSYPNGIGGNSNPWSSTSFVTAYTP
jgi:hypothetical protein